MKTTMGVTQLGKNQLVGLRGRELEEAKMALVQAGRVQWWRELMKQGKEEKAAGYAARYRFEAVIEPELAAFKKMAAVIGANPEPVDVLTEAATIHVAEAGTQVQSVQGWPVKVEAEVYRYPPNQQMVVVQLDDGRQARLWNKVGGKRWAMKSRVKMKLAEVNGDDAMYEGDYENGRPGS